MLKKIVQSPITLLISIGLGILVGIYVPGVANALKPINSIYSALLEVCAIPIIICVVTVNIGQLFKKELHGVLRKWLIFSILAIVLSSVVGIVASTAFQNFLAPDETSRVALTQADNDVNNKEISDSFSELKIYHDNDVSNESEFSFLDFFINMFPENIFEALSNNSTLEILMFFLIVGIMLSFVKEKHAQPVINLLNGISTALSKFTDELLLFLPVSVFIAMASLFSSGHTLKILDTIVDFIVVNYIALGVIILISMIIILICTKVPLPEHLSAIKKTFFLSLGISDSANIVPTTIADSVSKLKANESNLKSVLPIGVFFCPNGSVVSSAILAVYALIIYEHPIRINSLAIIVLGAILFSLSKTSGASTAVVLSVLLQPLGLPTDIMAIIFSAATQFYSGFSTFVDIYSNLAVTLLATNKNKLNEQSTKTLVQVPA